ncbi:MAG: hypothetical protein Q9227_001959 [Pyrenula ochraceoflavens]
MKPAASERLTRTRKIFAAEQERIESTSVYDIEPSSSGEDAEEENHEEHLVHMADVEDDENRADEESEEEEGKEMITEWCRDLWSIGHEFVRLLDHQIQVTHLYFLDLTRNVAVSIFIFLVEAL